jgi:hypothetical protein
VSGSAKARDQSPASSPGGHRSAPSSTMRRSKIWAQMFSTMSPTARSPNKRVSTSRVRVIDPGCGGGRTASIEQTLETTAELS